MRSIVSDHISDPNCKQRDFSCLRRKMLRLFLVVMAWLLYWDQQWLKVYLSDIQNILPCWPERKGEYMYAFNTAKTITRVIYLLYIVYYVIHYFFLRHMSRMLSDSVINSMTHNKVPKFIHKDRVLQSSKVPISNIGLHILSNVLNGVRIEYAGMTILEKLKLFHQSFQLFTSLATIVRPDSYSAGDTVCKKGTAADNIYMVVNGILEATTATGGHLETMSPGDIFGEIGVLHIDGYKTRTANVHSVTHSKLFAINKRDFAEIINKLPQSKKLIVNIGKWRLRRSTCEALYL
ncbi:jg17824 [Pararge aegeria aegeria]|uniref:Jg17824 protein n=1 Tax=Pararge aegeria aegeria TaxID=348720 RepID=A0A8S4SIW5_9NEOP|nr:jg17824 [Pararge aegeria aegeria]